MTAIQLVFKHATFSEHRHRLNVCNFNKSKGRGVCQKVFVLQSRRATVLELCVLWQGVYSAKAQDQTEQVSSDFKDSLNDLIKAKSALEVLKVVAELPKDSKDRRKYEAYYPGFAKKLRQVSIAAPIVVDYINHQGQDNLSTKYGGNVAEGQGMLDSLFEAVGNILTLSGRTISEQARYDPKITQQALIEVEKILADVKLS